MAQELREQRRPKRQYILLCPLICKYCARRYQWPFTGYWKHVRSHESKYKRFWCYSGEKNAKEKRNVSRRQGVANLRDQLATTAQETNEPLPAKTNQTHEVTHSATGSPKPPATKTKQTHEVTNSAIDSPETSSTKTNQTHEVIDSAIGSPKPSSAKTSQAHENTHSPIGSSKPSSAKTKQTHEVTDFTIGSPKPSSVKTKQTHEVIDSAIGSPKPSSAKTKQTHVVTDSPIGSPKPSSAKTNQTHEVTDSPKDQPKSKSATLRPKTCKYCHRRFFHRFWRYHRHLRSHERRYERHWYKGGHLNGQKRTAARQSKDRDSNKSSKTLSDGQKRTIRPSQNRESIASSTTLSDGQNRTTVRPSKDWESHSTSKTLEVLHKDNTSKVVEVCVMDTHEDRESVVDTHEDRESVVDTHEDIDSVVDTHENRECLVDTHENRESVMDTHKNRERLSENNTGNSKTTSDNESSKQVTDTFRIVDESIKDKEEDGRILRENLINDRGHNEAEVSAGSLSPKLISDRYGIIEEGIPDEEEEQRLPRENLAHDRGHSEAEVTAGGVSLAINTSELTENIAIDQQIVTHLQVPPIDPDNNSDDTSSNATSSKKTTDTSGTDEGAITEVKEEQVGYDASPSTSSNLPENNPPVTQTSTFVEENNEVEIKKEIDSEESPSQDSRVANDNYTIGDLLSRKFLGHASDTSSAENTGPDLNDNSVRIPQPVVPIKVEYIQGQESSLVTPGSHRPSDHSETGTADADITESRITQDAVRNIVRNESSFRVELVKLHIYPQLSQSYISNQSTQNIVETLHDDEQPSITNTPKTRKKRLPKGTGTGRVGRKKSGDGNHGDWEDRYLNELPPVGNRKRPKAGYYSRLTKGLEDVGKNACAVDKSSSGTDSSDVNSLNQNSDTSVEKFGTRWSLRIKPKAKTTWDVTKKSSSKGKEKRKEKQLQNDTSVNTLDKSINNKPRARATGKVVDTSATSCRNSKDKVSRKEKKLQKDASVKKRNQHKSTVNATGEVAAEKPGSSSRSNKDKVQRKDKMIQKDNTCTKLNKGNQNKPRAQTTLEVAEKRGSKDNVPRKEKQAPKDTSATNLNQSNQNKPRTQTTLEVVEKRGSKDNVPRKEKQVAKNTPATNLNQSNQNKPSTKTAREVAEKPVITNRGSKDKDLRKEEKVANISERNLSKSTPKLTVSLTKLDKLWSINLKPVEKYKHRKESRTDANIDNYDNDDDGGRHGDKSNNGKGDVHHTEHRETDTQDSSMSLGRFATRWSLRKRNDSGNGKKQASVEAIDDDDERDIADEEDHSSDESYKIDDDSESEENASSGDEMPKLVANKDKIVVKVKSENESEDEALSDYTNEVRSSSSSTTLKNPTENHDNIMHGTNGKQTDKIPALTPQQQPHKSLGQTKNNLKDEYYKKIARNLANEPEANKYRTNMRRLTKEELIELEKKRKTKKYMHNVPCFKTKRRKYSCSICGKHFAFEKYLKVT
ncbi:uncharacterized protein [Amphiura filiformis]|uniref:uncharacterized protein n=1 Tax=Amphiura filiformis TaxID=82378 RepID=UPI003B20C17B